MTWPGGPASTTRYEPSVALRKLVDIRALVTAWAAQAFKEPDDQRAQVMGECATLILMVTDP